MELLDALGNPVRMGHLYGYCRNDNGFTTVTLGTVESMNKKVTLKIESVKKCLYEDEFKYEKDHAEKISVRSFILFPVSRIN